MAATAKRGDANRVRVGKRSGGSAQGGSVESCRVVVVGAGASGLQAAQTLRTVYGITDVIVVEAADYVGG